MSGRFCAYACRGIPEGRGEAGRRIDGALLRSATCADLRARAQYAKRALREIVAERRSRGETTTILDVAAGQATYLRELFRELGEQSEEVYCYDRDPREVAEGREGAFQEGLRNFRFGAGDARDAASYLVPLHPHAVVAVGLLEALASDAEARRVIALAHGALAPHGYFLVDARTERPIGCQRWQWRLLGLSPAVRSARHVSSWLRQAGFEHVRTAGIGPDSVLFVARKSAGSSSATGDSNRHELR